MTLPARRSTGMRAKPRASIPTDRGRYSAGSRRRIVGGGANGRGGSPSRTHPRKKKRTLPYPEFQHASSVLSGAASHGSYSVPALNERYPMPMALSFASHSVSRASFHGS